MQTAPVIEQPRRRGRPPKLPPPPPIIEEWWEKNGEDWKQIALQQAKEYAEHLRKREYLRWKAAQKKDGPENATEAMRDLSEDVRWIFHEAAKLTGTPDTFEALQIHVNRLSS